MIPAKGLEPIPLDYKSDTATGTSRSSTPQVGLQVTNNFIINREIPHPFHLANQECWFSAAINVTKIVGTSPGEQVMAQINDRHPEVSCSLLERSK